MPKDPCRRLSGCSGTTPPTIEQYGNLGDTCNGTGLCQARNDNLVAECTISIPARCNFGQATDARFFCENGAGVSGNRRYCVLWRRPMARQRDVSISAKVLGLRSVIKASRNAAGTMRPHLPVKHLAVSIVNRTRVFSEGCRDQICRCFEASGSV